MATAQLNPESLNLIFETTKDAPERQLHDVEAMDAKAVQVFAAASIIIGLATLIGDAGTDVATAFLACALVAYAACVAMAMMALSIRTYFFTRQAESSVA